jgi:predicted CXXCH cytochrome family protein
MLGQNRVHQPVLEGRACLTCHGPHASKVKGLLRGTTLTVCGGCHADTTRRNENSATKHKPVAEGECTACHDPHSSGGALLLANADRIAMCGKCHDWATHSTHPIGEKKIDPRNKNLRVECLSCHRAHGTEFPKLMLAAKQSELCTKCHTSYVR